MRVTRLVLMLCIGCGIAFAVASVDAASGNRGLPPKGELTKKFNEKAKVRTPAKPPEKPVADRQGGPTPPRNFRNPGF